MKKKILMKNMTKTISLFLLICLMLGCISCGVQPGREQTEATEETGATEETIDIEGIDSLSLKAEIPGNYPETLSMYRLTDWEPDENILVPLYMKNEPNEVADLAQGKAFYYYKGEELSEWLILYNNKTHGGFKYSRTFSDEFQGLASKSVDVPNNVTTQYLNEQYLPFTDRALSFADKDEVTKAIAEYMEKSGFPEVRIRHFFSRDKDTLNHNIKLFNLEQNVIFEGDYEPFIEEFREEDEDYFIIYEQMIDTIPLTTISPIQSMIGGDSGWRVTETEIWFTWDSEGLDKIDCVNMFNVTDKLRDVKIISPEKAVGIYAEDYDKALHMEETEIIGVELNYTAMLSSKNDSITAKPIWIITTRTMKSNPMFDFLVPEYAVCGIDAETGKILESMYLDEE